MRTRRWCLFWARSYHISLTFILILSSHLRLSLPSGLFPSDYAFLISPMRATCHAHLIHFVMITLIIFGESVHVMKLLTGPNILLSTLFSDTPNLRSSPGVRPSFTPMQNNRQNYSSLYFKLQFFREGTGRQKSVKRIITSITWT
jgi:hypothetical protein